MLTDTDRRVIRKAMAFDLMCIIEERPEQETFTAEELKRLIIEYAETSS